MADVIVEGMLSVEGFEAKTFSDEDVDEAWVKESKCVVLGTPIYLASITGAIKNWFDTVSLTYGLAGKK